MDNAFNYFREVVRLGSIRQAAEGLHVSASSITRQIQKLEHLYDAELVLRHTQGVKLTPAGELLARFVQRHSHELQGLRSSIDALKGMQKGHVVICTVEGMIGGLLPRALAMFSRQHPGITYEVNVAGTDNVMLAVAEDRCDIGISFHPFPRNDVTTIATISQPLHALMVPSHPLATRKTLGFAELAGELIGLPDPTFGIRHLVDHVVKSGQLDVDIRLVSNSIDMLRQFARHEMGIVFMPTFASERELALKELVAVPLSDAALSNAMVQICKRTEFQLTLAAQGLVETLEKLARNYSGIANNATPRSDNDTS